MKTQKRPGVRRKRPLPWGYLIAFCIAVLLFLLFVFLGRYLGSLVA